jgi:hypothetical protein
MTARTTLDLGVAAAQEAIRHRQSFAPLVEAALNSRRGDILGGLVGVMCDLFDVCQAKGVSFEWKNARAKQVAEALPNARRLLVSSFASRANQDAGDVLAELCAALYGIREQLSATITEASPESPAVTLVQIVGMPERAGQTSIARDGDGAIVGSEFTERDAQEIPA